MQIRLYIDEDAMARGLVTGLRARGVDVETVLDAGLIGKDDETQLEYSSSHGRVLYSFNVGHFCELHRQRLAASRSRAGIIVVYRQRYSIGEQLRRLLLLVEAKPAEEMVDFLFFL